MSIDNTSVSIRRSIGNGTSFGRVLTGGTEGRVCMCKSVCVGFGPSGEH